MNEFTYKWSTKDLETVKKNGLKVFSCFAGSGGSSYGYKMAGCDVIGVNEIDKEMAEHYRINHNPKFLYEEDIRQFKKRSNLPDELFNLDILDGSPPCSSFSMAGTRHKHWNQKKVFKEGQSEQILDDLFFEFIDVVKTLQPKIVIAENVKGLISGSAKGYVKEIVNKFKENNYDVQLFLLNAASMGLPQKRERVFFICRNKKYNYKELRLKFNEKLITVNEAIGDLENQTECEILRPSLKNYWHKILPGHSVATVNESGSNFSRKKVDPNDACYTIHADLPPMHWKEPRHLSTTELAILSSYPIDCKFKNLRVAYYQMGMAVPPLMIYKITNEIIKQWFNQGEKE
jgi:DNA (cytosine-5)-methyltransferase 1